MLNRLYLSVPSQFQIQLKSRSPDRDSAFFVAGARRSLEYGNRTGAVRRLLNAAVSLWITLLITAGSGAVSSAVTAQETVSSVDELVPLQSRSESLTWGDLHVTESGDAAGQPVLFLHGTPGSAEFFTRYLVHPRLQDLRLLAIDRPGWGNSILRENFDATLATQSETVGEFLCSLVSPEFRPVVVAHSYGATLAPRLMMEYPDCVAATLLLAGAADPLLAGPRWYNWLTEFPPVSWVVALSGTGLKQSNDEMMRIRAGLEEVKDTWTLIRHPVTLIQGEDDWLVDPDHADFIEAKLAHIPARIILVEKEGHLIVHRDPDLIIAELRALLAQL
ncbi:MAG: alpha/beta fold hydrolase [Pseudohongiellaceae bacterium]